ncbi:MAG TPA: FHA domain-containing protein [Marinagarivorans sp.]
MLQLRFTNSAKPAMWLVAPKYTFGAKHSCDCVLAQPGVAPVHAEITVAGESVSLVRIDENATILVNDRDVTESQPLKPGDAITLGEAELAIADPKLEGPKRDFSDKTNIRASLSAAGAAEPQSQEALWHLRPLNTTLAKSDGFDLLGSMLLGRSKECDICIPASHLSRKHAKFTVSSTGLTVDDLGSSNGTFINGKRIEHISLYHGDEVSFDTLRFRVEQVSNVEDVTTLRAALDETQIRQAVSPNQIERKQAHNQRKVRPVRPKAAATPSAQEGSTADTIKLLAAAVTIVGVVAWLAWFLLN